MLCFYSVGIHEDIVNVLGECWGKSGSLPSEGRAINCTLKLVTPQELPTESPIAEFLVKEIACELPQQ